MSRLLSLALALFPLDDGAQVPLDAPRLPDEGCELSEEDGNWIRDALAGWRFVAREVLRIEAPPAPIAIFFDARCARSTDALHLDGRELEWHDAPHEGEVLLPTGDAMPPVVASFAAPLEGGGGSFFVMSTPSVWRAGGVRSTIDLPTFMTAVLVHEISHTTQVDTYMRRVSELEEAGGFGEDLDDDVLQDTFGADVRFAKAVEAETELLFRAAAAETEAEARRLAAEALDSIVARREGYRDRPELHELEDVFLTLEGAAQWTALAWLTSSEGGGVDEPTALREFGRRTDRWSQLQGLGLFLVIDRFLDDWESTVYGRGRETALQLFDRALDGER